jgi:D-galactarolactone cycloisomerase
MKITELKVHVLKSPLAEPFCLLAGLGAPALRHAGGAAHRRRPGRLGRGLRAGLEPPEIAAAAIEHALKPLVLGAEPADTEVLWHRMYHRTRDYGRKGSVIAAISAVDTALWDLAGKAHGLPVHTSLLGGAFRRGCSPMPPASTASAARAKRRAWPTRRCATGTPASG